MIKRNESAKYIILIAPFFFRLHEDIKKQMEKDGYTVFLYNDRPSSNKLVKALIRINRCLLEPVTSGYVRRIIKNTKHYNIEKVIVIDGQGFTARHVLMLKKAYPASEFVLYMWDSIRNYPYTCKLMSFFNRMYSFDIKDCTRYPNLMFLPLFYSDNIYKCPKAEKPKYDFAFVGTGHPNKYYYLNQIKMFLDSNNFNYKFHIYLPSRTLFYFYKIFYKQFCGAKISYFKFDKMSADTISYLYANTRFVIDVGNPEETGIPLRFFECLITESKLITTNKSIANYDFFKSQNIYIYHGGLFDMGNSFFHTPYLNIDRNILSKYHISFWVRELLGSGEKKTYIAKCNNSLE